MNILAPITQASDAVSKAYVDGLLAEYTKTENLGALASKNSLAFSELTGKPTTLAGYGVSNVDVSGYIKGGSTITCKGDLLSLTDDNQNYNWRIASIIDGAQLQVGYRDNSSNKGKFYFTGMWGKELEAFFVRANGAYFDGADVYFRNTGKTQFAASALFQSGIKISAGQAISFLGSDGVEHKLTYDSNNGAFKIDGNFYTTGQNAAGEAGQSAGTSQAVNNLVIDFHALNNLIELSGSVNDAEMSAVGLTSAAIGNILDAVYNKIVGASTDRNVWNYTAYETGGGIYIQLMQGDGLDILSSYSLSRNPSTGYWTILYSER